MGDERKIVSVRHEGKTGTVFFEDGSTMEVVGIKALSHQPLRLALLDPLGNELPVSKDEVMSFLSAMLKERDNWDITTKHFGIGTDN